jgi:hypothetical protein
VWVPRGLQGVGEFVGQTFCGPIFWLKHQSSGILDHGSQWVCAGRPGLIFDWRATEWDVTVNSVCRSQCSSSFISLSVFSSSFELMDTSKTNWINYNYVSQMEFWIKLIAFQIQRDYMCRKFVPICKLAFSPAHCFATRSDIFSTPQLRLEISA